MKTAIPQLHDKPPRFLFWPFDQTLIALMGIGLGILANAILLFTVLGLYAAHRYAKFRGTRHAMYLLHWAYWHLGSWVLPCKALPPSWQREFIG